MTSEPTTRVILREWFAAGVAQGATHMIVVTDEFTWDDYPIYIEVGQDARAEAKRLQTQPLLQVMEVYRLDRSIDIQLGERRAFHY